jgi:hypothetical protein
MAPHDTHTGGTDMKPRLFALLAVPALALGFAVATPRSAEAMPPIYFPTCAFLGYKISEAQYWGDTVSEEHWIDLAWDNNCVSMDG